MASILLRSSFVATALLATTARAVLKKSPSGMVNSPEAVAGVAPAVFVVVEVVDPVACVVLAGADIFRVLMET